MKQYHYKEYGGNGDYRKGYRKNNKKKTTSYNKKTTLPWKNYQKSIYST